jgi:iron complex transport system substrate-binding protein
MARLGLKLEEVPIASTVEQSIAQVRQLASLSGHPERGEALVRRIEVALAAARPIDKRVVPAVVWQSGGIVPGEGALITDLLRRTGFASPLEQMLADPPRVILATSRDHSGEDRMLAHPALRSLKETRREPLDPSLLWCGGPTIPLAVARLAEVRRAL